MNKYKITVCSLLLASLLGCGGSSNSTTDNASSGSTSNVVSGDSGARVSKNLIIKDGNDLVLDRVKGSELGELAVDERKKILFVDSGNGDDKGSFNTSIYDISNPRDIKLESVLIDIGGSISLEHEGNEIFLGDSYVGNLNVPLAIDITNPSNPIILSHENEGFSGMEKFELSWSSSYSGFHESILSSKNILYFLGMDEEDNNYLMSFDMNNYLNPSHISSMFLGKDGLSKLLLFLTLSPDEKYLYGYYRNEFISVDINDIDNMKIVGRMEIASPEKDNLIGLLYSEISPTGNRIYGINKKVYSNQYIAVIDVSNPSDPKIIDKVLGDDITNIALSKKEEKLYVFVNETIKENNKIGSEFKVKIFDIKNDKLPEMIGVIKLGKVFKDTTQEEIYDMLMDGSAEVYDEVLYLSRGRELVAMDVSIFNEN
jgi:hypothetical protein